MTDISSMTDEQLNEALAIEVMGWRKDAIGDWWVGKKDNIMALKELVEDWQPCIDLNQAVECADYMANLGFNWSVDNIENDHYHASVYRPSTEHIYFCDANIPARALSEAVLMAVRGEG